MNVVCEIQGEVGIAKLAGQLTAATVETFKSQLATWQALTPTTVNLVIDMSAVDFMDSAGLGALIATLKHATDVGGDVRIAALQKKPRMVFDITRAFKIFDIHDTVMDAVRSYSA
jgi:anti-sigma B factor antagonist